MKTRIVLIVAIIATALVVGALLKQNQTARDIHSAQGPALPKAASSRTPPIMTAIPPAFNSTEAPTSPPSPPKEPQTMIAVVPKQTPPSTPSQPAPANAPAKEPASDPFARMALAFVGADPDAEAYWLAAINDPSLPAQERQDLIEDLNEDGLSNPKHPTPDDLPLILNRIQMIEEIGPYAMDQVNADAFKEAYKDLLNLASLSMGGGEPVK